MNRKEWKSNARKTLKRHYLLHIFICLLLGMLGLQYTSSLSTIKSVVRGGSVLENYRSLFNVEKEIEAEISGEGETESGTIVKEAETKEKASGQSIFSAVFSLITEGRFDESRRLADETRQELSTTEEKLGMISIGHSRGVLSELVNITSSGTILTMGADAIRSMLHSDTATMLIMIFLSGVFIYLVRVFIFKVIHVTTKRFFMESRIYEEVPVQRFVFFIRVKRWARVAHVMFVEMIYHFLWLLTIVGGIIKKYSYFMTPYIVAENPDIKAKDAITLSRRMMDGHKWECFKLNISFLGWDIIDYFTLGFVGILYANPYEENAYAEYYAYIRGLAIEKQIPGIELLNDRYLYEKADGKLLNETYSGAIDTSPLPEVYGKELNPVSRFIRSVFGICLRYDDAERRHEQRTLREVREKDYRACMAGKQYPSRLFSIAEKDKVKQIEHINYLRHYSLISIILIFFAFCMIGWSWEVSLHLISEAKFVNRGVLHGPWLPIYGSGGVLILIVLNKLRKKPMVEFISAIVLCGILEYTSGWYLEITHNGKKWWDYSGYFLNIHGRVCAEGLLVFGLGGMAIVYLVAPILDQQIRKIPAKIAIPICALLLGTYVADQIYSKDHPNEGEGVTSVQLEQYSDELMEFRNT